MKISASACNTTTLVSSTLLSSASITATARCSYPASSSSSSSPSPSSSRISNSSKSPFLSRRSFSTSRQGSDVRFKSKSFDRDTRLPEVWGAGAGKSGKEKDSETPSSSPFTGNSENVFASRPRNFGYGPTTRIIGGSRMRGKRYEVAGLLDKSKSSSSLSNSTSRSMSTSAKSHTSDLLSNSTGFRKDFFKPSFNFGERSSTSVSAPSPNSQVTCRPQSQSGPSLLSLLLPPKEATPSAMESLTEIYQPRSNDPFMVSPSATSSSPTEISNLKAIPRLTPRVTFRLYKQLAKARLTYLIVLTSMSGYALCPSLLSISSSTSIATISVPTLLSLTVGTALCCSSANAFNQLTEVPYDAQMSRTRNRPLPSRNLTPLHAFSFASFTGLVGITTLYHLVNPLTAFLGAFNIFLYAGVYTPMKRLSIVNTWVGSLVGGIPPLMGWAACTGTLFLPTDLPAWILASLLFVWQFPHFNSLSHAIRSEYARGGYRMTSVLNPDLNKRVGLRYAMLCLPICLSLPLTGVVTPVYALLSTPPNLALIHASWKFWKFGGDRNAKSAFFISMVQLPAVLLLAMVCKTELWDAVSTWWNGGEEEEERIEKRVEA